MFIDARELALGHSAAQVTDTSSAITALRSLAALYKAIVQAVKDEAIITEQVFPSPSTALVLFVTRLFEQRVQVCTSCSLANLLLCCLSACVHGFVGGWDGDQGGQVLLKGWGVDVCV